MKYLCVVATILIVSMSFVIGQQRQQYSQSGSQYRQGGAPNSGQQTQQQGQQQYSPGSSSNSQQSGMSNSYSSNAQQGQPQTQTVDKYGRPVQTSSNTQNSQQSQTVDKYGRPVQAASGSQNQMVDQYGRPVASSSGGAANSAPGGYAGQSPGMSPYGSSSGGGFQHGQMPQGQYSQQGLSLPAMAEKLQMVEGEVGEVKYELAQVEQNLAEAPNEIANELVDILEMREEADEIRMRNGANNNPNFMSHFYIIAGGIIMIMHLLDNHFF